MPLDTLFADVGGGRDMVMVWGSAAGRGRAANASCGVGPAERFKGALDADGALCKAICR